MWLTVAVVVPYVDADAVKKAMESYCDELDPPGNWWFIGTENARFEEKKKKHAYLEMPFAEETRCDMCRGCVTIEEAMEQKAPWAVVTPDGSWFDPDKAVELGMSDADTTTKGRQWPDAYGRVLARYPKHVVVYVGGHK